MGKYAKYERKSQRKTETVHPIWRGIGCILIFLVPLLSYALADVLVKPLISTGLVPYQLQGFVRFPDWAYRTIIIQDLATFIGRINNLYALLILFFVILIVLIGLFSTVYTAIYQYTGPKRYTDLDAPPANVKAKKYKR